MFYITGDTHRDFERIEEFCDYYGTTEDDVLVILGDAGINFYLDESDYEVKRELAELPVTLFCIHGNHEERPFMIDGYEEQEWRGGIVYVEAEFPRLLFAKDGEIFDFDGKKAIAIGGAYSIDKFWRITNNAPWFPTEQPDEKTMRYVEKQLEKNKWTVDYVFSHTCPRRHEPTDLFLPSMNQGMVDSTTGEWLNKIEDKLSFESWYFGHFHADRMEGQFTMLFQEIEELD